MLATPRPLRVCHLGKYYPPAPGGIESHVQTLARAQARLGAQVRVICVNHADHRGRDVTWSRRGATRLRRHPDGPVHVTRVGRSLTFARLDFCPALPAILRRLNRHPPDVLHLHTPNPTMVLLVAALVRRDLTLVISHHSDIVRQRLLRWAHEPFERMVYGRSAAVLASSRRYVEGSRVLRQHEGKLHTLPMGIELDRYTHPAAPAVAVAAQLRRRLGGVLWLCVGRCVYYKGLAVAIEALRHVAGTLLVIGRGPLARDLSARADALGVGQRIVRWDWADEHELIGAYLAATALWFPSNARSESFGLVQVEAMAAGCPVINTNLPGSGVPWVSLHEQTGLTVPVNNPAALAAAARRLLGEPGLRQRLAEGGRRRAREEFDHLTMARRSLAIYREAMRRAEAPHGAAAPAAMNWNARLRALAGRRGINGLREAHGHGIEEGGVAGGRVAAAAPWER